MAEDLARPAEFAAGAGPRPGARQAQGIAAALRAAAGDGKTVRACALPQRGRVQNAFDDRILWGTVEEPRRSDGARSKTSSICLQPSAWIRRHRGGDGTPCRPSRGILIVIDDPWDAAHLRLFIQGGPRGARDRCETRGDLDVQ